MKVCAVRSYLGKFFLVFSLLLVSTVQAQTATWTQIAREGFNFTLSAPGTVRYGANSKWVQKNFLAGTYKCTNETFGFDPFPRKAKSCQLQSTTTPAPSPTYAITPSTTSVNEGSSLTLSVATTNVGSATLYWSIEMISGSVMSTDFTNTLTGSVPVTNNSGSVVIGISADSLTEGTEQFRVSLRTGSATGTTVTTSGTITINDTSTTPPPPPVTWTFVANEGSQYALIATTSVRYGANGLYYTQTRVAGTYWCTNEAFGGDPVVGVSKKCEVLDASAIGTVTPPPPPPPPPPPSGSGGLDANLMPIVNRSLIMAPRAGSSTVDIYQTTEVAPLSDIGAFRTVCAVSHMNFDDPIIFPGQQDRTHLHVYFGNTGTNYATTPATLVSTGNGTCRGGIVNRSAYWMPAMIDIRDGRPIVPDLMHVYYKSGYNNNPLESINYIPNGLRVIAGNSMATTTEVNGDAADVRYQCFGPVVNGPVLKHIPVCATGDIVWISLNIPNCWDGVNLDSPDHRSHMTHSWLWGPGGGSCPASHPVALPQISLIIVYNVTSIDDTSKWRLSSDMYGLDKPGGYSLHGDLMFGWREDIMKAFIDNCTKARRDCRSHLLGDGRGIFGER